ncbi:Protein PLANT CADMIUM RESISTANCE 2 [Geodia barretti]|uniref:Protein PLANT CADMIUM RESISTANCE 2 n=1 Tax=Geodia barretti TaxID=519541 RepID=A0AA35SFG6_GEOBA|nr:Protein PLANT CADMIUM RESISTANCE 2 [Geodia barretti]
MSREWTNGVFGCFNDCSTCIIAYFCPCYVFGKNAEAVGDNCVLCALSQFVPLLDLWARVSVRGKIREQKGIEGSCFKDLICHWCCGLCSIVQEAQELKAPGGQGMARE